MYCCSPDSVNYWGFFQYMKSRVCAFASLGAIAAAGSRCCVRWELMCRVLLLCALGSAGAVAAVFLSGVHAGAIP